MEYQAFTVSQAASQLGVSPSSVRRLCSEYVSHLSDGANPGKGSVRKLSEADVQTLSEVIKLKAQGLSVENIRQQLGSMVFHTAIEPARAAQVASGAAIVPAVVVDSLQAIETRLTALEAQRQRFDVAYLVAIAFIAGLLLGLAMWWFR